MFLFDCMVLEVLRNGPQNGLHFDANIFQDVYYVCYVIFGVGGTPKGLHLDTNMMAVMLSWALEVL